MKKLGIVLSLVLGTILLAGSALAQGDKSVYFTTYYANANVAGAPDSTLRIVNDGYSGNLWASFYVFDDSQELQECCSCRVSADGLLSESVNNELLANPPTSKANHAGEIAVIASSTQGPSSNTPAPGLKGNFSYDIATNTADTTVTKNAVVSNAVNQYLVLEHPLADSNLTTSHQSQLQNLCSYAITLGSGTGVCSCTPEGKDF
ncbi:MAG: hypothetical protein WA646_17980 [Candidatus Sulfotelmatobacter sp.]